MDYLETVITLQPGPLSPGAVRQLLEQVLDEWGWFTPALVGRVTPDQALPGLRGAVEEISELWDGGSWLAVGSKRDRDVLMLSMDKQGERSHLGELTWFAPVKSGHDPSWLASHASQVGALMLQLDSPYGYAGLADSMRTKTHREATDPRGFTIETYTVRDHSEGLAGLFWRNFFGRPLQQMFGDRLVGVAQDLDGLALVEPYDTPDEALTDEGRQREAELIALLGSDCFYDHERAALPTRRPRLD